MRTPSGILHVVDFKTNQIVSNIQPKDYREIIDPNEELRKMYNKILATLGSKANKELLDRLEQLVKENDQKANTA
ncbi:hypothetical protein [Bacillus paramycoides]|uniref:hypothetical protein n=1 Tax=Bacillus paramycoides TaxID=2026194 RepID=UPI002E2186AE|nr:hypothetical protein [Bacillus paramycoides]